jgi:hypothetical protein
MDISQLFFYFETLKKFQILYGLYLFKSLFSIFITLCNHQVLIHFKKKYNLHKPLKIEVKTNLVPHPCFLLCVKTNIARKYKKVGNLSG